MFTALRPLLRSQPYSGPIRSSTRRLVSASRRLCVNVLDDDGGESKVYGILASNSTLKTKKTPFEINNETLALATTREWTSETSKKKVNMVSMHRQIHTTSRNMMFIQVEETPNPNSLKFYPGEVVLDSGTADFRDKAQGSLKSPLAKALFKIRGVKSVFFAQDFITVSKDDDEKFEWSILKPQIFSAIMIFYTMKQPILLSSVDADPNEINENDSEIVRQIKSLITDKIRPTIQEDGGDLEFVEYEDRVVRVRLQGACTSCPSSVVTLKNGIKNMLQFYIPEVVDVEQVKDDIDD